MRYRIQVEPLLGATLVVITKIEVFRERSTHSTRLYTLEGDFDHGGLTELLGELQRVVGESEG
jgi:hypothetical protein